jgi:uncharacterized protein HemY
MRKTVVILTLLIIGGCKTPGNLPAPPVSRFDIAIENLSITSQKLEDLRAEKEIFTSLLADFEQQKAENALDTEAVDKQIKAFAEWHRDISQREKDLNIEYSMNVSAAHREILKRKEAEANEITLASPVKKP